MFILFFIVTRVRGSEKYVKVIQTYFHQQGFDDCVFPSNLRNLNKLISTQL